MKESSLPFFDATSIRKLGMAIHLLRFLSEKQTDPAGKVWYGRPLSYRQIQSWLGGEIPISMRSIRRWLCRLKENGHIETKIDPGRSGLSITILNQKKFSAPGPFAPQKTEGIQGQEGKQNAKRLSSYEEVQRIVERVASRIRPT